MACDCIRDVLLLPFTSNSVSLPHSHTAVKLFNYPATAASGTMPALSLATFHGSNCWSGCHSRHLKGHDRHDKQYTHRLEGQASEKT
eukprot:4688583-Amphidinium_carterae.1